MSRDIGVEIQLDPNEPLFNPPAGQKNWNKLPEESRRMTFHGRYDLQDRYLLKMLDVDSYPKDRDISVLDFAGGILSSGSPTAEDLYSKIRSSDHNAVIHVVDSYFPKRLKPDIKEVKYLKSLEADPQKEFDIVRVLRLVEHISGKEYEQIREKLIERIREGGIFIATQKLGYLRRDSYGGLDKRKLKSPVIKIMQKRNGIMIPIALLPDSQVPVVPNGSFFGIYEDNYDELYKQWKKDIEKRKSELPRKIADDGYSLFMDWLFTMNPKVLEHESFEMQLTKGLVRIYRVDPINPEGANILNMLRDNAKDTAGYFQSTAKT